MFTQFDDGCSASEGCAADTPSRALVARPRRAVSPSVAAALARRITDCASQKNRPTPIVVPGASVSLLSVALPLKSHRQRARAATFAVAGQLCDTTGNAHVAVGPCLGSDRYLVAVCDDAVLAEVVRDRAHPGIVLPDTLGIPKPVVDKPAWNLWEAEGIVHARAADGTGFVCHADELTALWRLAGKPDLYSLTGPVTNGPAVVDLSHQPPAVDPDDLLLDLRHGPYLHRRRAPRRVLRLAIAATFVAGFGHMSLLAANTRALTQIADDRMTDIATQLDHHAPGLSPDQPLRLIAAQFARNGAPRQQDPFMTILAHVSQALKPQLGMITFRELRYGAREGVLTLLVQGTEFEPLQAAEAALMAAGLEVTSGTATATDGGAEVLIQVRDRP
ncbi:hypothetical protein KX928_06485 [Roseobacter sp. YSTF-M11]|uniref:GspL cytoplasmic actin-ATPase-like domain-containing protein n=1 Tax=Roseobacter insulae TaxID=2859783 RepID=A0A9X1JZR1_9RHOB|nr:type II secretion system protein GspL [Roseobacter insulae]MBW4707429.1 hypothetical protein [Roseobacter insulae]